MGVKNDYCEDSDNEDDLHNQFIKGRGQESHNERSKQHIVK